MFEKLLARTARALDGARIPYMVVGGQAVLLYGEPRLTKDIDITLGVAVGRLAEVLAVVDRLGFKTIVDPDGFAAETMVLPCSDESSGVQIDLIFSDTRYEREAIDRGRMVELGGARVRFASPEDLIIHKVVAGRPRDMEDARSVLLKNPALDRDLIRDNLAEFEQALAEPFAARFDALLRVGDSGPTAPAAS